LSSIKLFLAHMLYKELFDEGILLVSMFLEPKSVQSYDHYCMIDRLFYLSSDIISRLSTAFCPLTGGESDNKMQD
jgi:hypothetical protein